MGCVRAATDSRQSGNLSYEARWPRSMHGGEFGVSERPLPTGSRGNALAQGLAPREMQRKLLKGRVNQKRLNWEFNRSAAIPPPPLPPPPCTTGDFTPMLLFCAPPPEPALLRAVEP